MPNTREKLIELLACAEDSLLEQAVAWDDEQKEEHIADGDGYGFYADHLIANGVTVQKWIPVTERLPEEHDSVFAKMYGTNRWMPGMFRTLSDTVIVCVEGTDGRKKTAAMHTKDRKWDMSARHLRGDNVTHWMPLPEPPKDGD